MAPSLSPLRRVTARASSAYPAACEWPPRLRGATAVGRLVGEWEVARMIGTKVRIFSPLSRDVSLEELFPKDHF